MRSDFRVKDSVDLKELLDKERTEKLNDVEETRKKVLIESYIRYTFENKGV